MTPKEKAQELVDKFTSSLFDTGHRISKPMIKLCALIAVDEIISQLKELRKPENCIFIDDYTKPNPLNGYEKIDYWQQVKSEIEKL